MDIGAYERQSLTVEIPDVASPAITPVDEVAIQFSSPVTGFDLADLELSLNGSENLLTGGETLSTSDNQTFVLGRRGESDDRIGLLHVEADLSRFRHCGLQRRPVG